MSAQMFVLYEHAAGYALFKVKAFEEVAMFLPELEASVTELNRFNQLVTLNGFCPFKSAVTALENINSISEGLVTEELQHFLDLNLPKSGKKMKVTLGVADSKLGAAIAETLSIQCSHIGAVPEIVRGIKMHFAQMVKGFSSKDTARTAELGLGHSYSRAKVKFNVHRVDNMIIQSIALLDQLDKDVNTFAMRIREWYSYHFPELYKIVPDNYLFAKVAKFIGNRKLLSEEKLDELEAMVMDSDKAKAILDASRSSMGMDISPIDLLNINLFASRVVALSDYRKELAIYLHSKMADVAPNLATLIGDQVGARLISHAGSLTNLAKCPASTVQILGAEKALFRALKTRGNTPKFGLLFHSTFIGRAGTKNKGRISRYLANKCSIASRIDCFADNLNSVYGDKLRQQVEDRLTFYENGTKPKKNIEVMQEAQREVELQQSLKAKGEKSGRTKQKKKAKKEKKRKLSENGSALDIPLNGLFDETATTTEEPPKKKKKKKKKIKSEPVD